ncbi:MAG: modification methylase [Desulfobacteraceae bacterium]|nr:adenine-specific methyltransferase EcoRI family protein [Desulfobacteraceae bacterium]MBC2758016.1 modification methylase [Desulfobacteraceae bacterium]
MAREGSVKYMNYAKSKKNDEFYTILSDIEKEMKHYKAHFKNKAVYCNCDDPYESNFFKFFAANFEYFGLKKLIVTSYGGSPIIGSQLPLLKIKGVCGKEPIKMVINEVKDYNEDGSVDLSDVQLLLKNDANTSAPLKQGGDFRSGECIELLKEADIVVTNPPFSLFREYVNQLIEYGKKFLIVGTWNVITYKEIFPLIKANKMWIGINSNRNFSGFIVPSHYPLSGTEARVDENGNRIVSSNNTCWFTNLDNAKRHEKLILYKKYNSEEYPQYDNYDAIEVSKTNNIPIDYDGVMGVPVTFLNKYNPKQFEIIGCNRGVGQDPEGVYGRGSFLNGKETFKRLFIRKRIVKK